MEGKKYVLLIDIGLSHCHNDYKPSTLEECPLTSEVSSTPCNIKVSGGRECNIPPIKIVCNFLCQAKQYQVTIWVEPTNPPTYHLVEDGFQDAEGKDVSVSKWNEHVTCGYNPEQVLCGIIVVLSTKMTYY